jgi:endonuclease YncB( thermonuclease family)
MAGMPRLRLLQLLLLLALAPPGTVRAEPPFQASVVSIGDGDSLRVQRGQQRITIRLACIDAPELAQSPWGERARQYLQLRLPIGRQVTILPQTIDRYGRTVAEVISDTSINLALVEDGLAFAYRRYLSQCDSREFLEAEFRASRQRHGVWQVPRGITRPWDYRRGRAAERSLSPHPADRSTEPARDPGL